MLAHAASAQGISAVENMCGRSHTLNHLSVPAACFTHPEARLHDFLAASASIGARKSIIKNVLHACQAGLLPRASMPKFRMPTADVAAQCAWCVLQVSFVGLTEEAAREQAEKDGYKDKIAVTKTSFKANSKVVHMSQKLGV